MEGDVTKKVTADQPTEFRIEVAAAKSKVNDSSCSHSQGSDRARAGQENNVELSSDEVAELLCGFREAVRVKKAKEDWATAEKLPVETKETAEKLPVETKETAEKLPVETKETAEKLPVETIAKAKRVKETVDRGDGTPLQKLGAWTQQNSVQREECPTAEWNKEIQFGGEVATDEREAKREYVRVIKERRGRPPEQERRTDDGNGDGNTYEGPACVEFMDDVVVMSGRPIPRTRGRKVWQMRPPRPGHARPIPRAQGRAGGCLRQEAARGRRERPPDNILTAVLDACRESQMSATMNLGQAFNHANITITPMKIMDRQGRYNQQHNRGYGISRRDRKLRQNFRRNGVSQMARAARQKRVECYGCGSQHKLRACPTTTDRMKERIWALLEARDKDLKLAAAEPKSTSDGDAGQAESKTEGQNPPETAGRFTSQSAGQQEQQDPHVNGKLITEAAEALLMSSKKAIPWNEICGRCMSRGHHSGDCDAPPERVYNPGYWAKHEPALRVELEQRGKKWGAGGVNWEDPDWQIPPVQTREVESTSGDEEF
jgi:hypothetical protein